MSINEAIDLIIKDSTKTFTITFPLNKKAITDKVYLINIGGELAVWRYGKFCELLVCSDKYMKAIYTVFEGPIK